MESIVGNTFLRASPSRRQTLKDTVWDYVKYEPFARLIHQINVNDTRGAQITHICLQLAQFNGNPKLWDNVERWLDS